MNKIYKLSPFFAVFALIFIIQTGFSCTPKPAIKEEAEQEPAISIDSVSPEISWEDRWNKLLGGAKREGKLFLAVSLGREEGQQLQEAIREKLQIEVTILTGQGGQMAQKILTERRAGLYLWDVYMGGSNTIAATLKPAGYLPFEDYLFLPEVIDKKNWWEEKFHWVDEPDNTILNFGGGPTLTILINKEIVKEGEVGSYIDLLNPKWKGKILMYDPSVEGKGLNWFQTVGTKIMDMDYMRKLAQQNPSLTRDQLLLAEWVARGKFPISLCAGENEVQRFQEVGAPIDYIVPKEGTYIATDGANMVFLDKAAHLNAAKAFVNWILSREGQTIYNKINVSIESYRRDTPKGHLDPRGLLQPGIKYIRGDDYKMKLRSPEFAAMAREIFQVR